MTPNNQTRAAAAAAELHDVFDITVGNSDRQFAQWVTPAQIEAIIARHFDESALRAAAIKAVDALEACDRFRDWISDESLDGEEGARTEYKNINRHRIDSLNQLRAALSVKPSEGQNNL